MQIKNTSALYILGNILQCVAHQMYKSVEFFFSCHLFPGSATGASGDVC